jgi:hypothetical protein
VNGAQTVGTIGSVINAEESEESSGIGSDSAGAWVQVRIISLEKCPPELSRAITRAANLQNAVGNREFAGMDPVQHRIATEFTLDRRRYAYKQGEADPRGDEGCNIVDATQALACAHSIALAVQAKKEIGGLWANTDAPPYTELFNAHSTSSRLWRLVVIMRTVDDTLGRVKSANIPRADLVAIHLNRVILHLVFRDPAVQPFLNDYSLESEARLLAAQSAESMFVKVSEDVQLRHKDDYLASLSKNLTKCEAMVNRLLKPASLGSSLAGEQDDLF